MPFTLGALSAVPASERIDLLAPSVLAALTDAGLLDEVGVVEIDPAVSDTAATQERYGLSTDTLANCVVKRRVAETSVIIIGSGVRRSKLLLPGALLARLPRVEVVDGLAS
jgi:prolyl-tRNA editing enzyme YbaK/EbsC (Cys-tRNA(Pro) deacylase)